MSENSGIKNLIDSLSKTEKSYYKKFTSGHGDTSSRSSAKLFDLYVSVGIKDSDKIVKQLSGIPESQFPVMKNYLFNSILKSLNSYHLENRIVIKLSSLINSAGVLYRKGLFDESLKVLTSARNLAEKNENDLKLLEIVNLERSVIRGLSSLNRSSQMLMENYEEERIILERIENLRQYKKLFDEMVIHATEEGSGTTIPRPFLEGLLKNKLLTSKENALSLNSKILYHIIISVSSSLLNIKDKALHHAEEIVNICNEDPIRKITYGYEFVLANQQIINVMRSEGKVKKASDKTMELLENIDGYLSNYPQRVKTFLYVRTLLPEVFYHLQVGEFETAKEKIERLIPYIPQNPYRDENLVIYHMAAVSNFALGEYEESLTYVNKILNYSGLPLRTDIQIAVRIINILIHYELGNIESISYLTRSTSRYIKKKERLSETEKEILRLVKEYSTHSNEIHILKELKSKLKKYKKNRSINLSGLFILENWLESKISYSTFKEAVIRDLYNERYYSR